MSTQPSHKSVSEEKMQGHWLLASLGKKVLRPGGLELTRRMLTQAQPNSSDDIVEFGPGVGKTATLLLEYQPASYTAVDAHPEGQPALLKVLDGHNNCRFVEADAQSTGLPDECATLVVGEAILSMCSPGAKRAIVAEAARILKPGGRYAIHELGQSKDAPDVDEYERNEVSKDLSLHIKVAARPLKTEGWAELLEDAGFSVVWGGHAPMHLLEPARFLADEGVMGTLRFSWNLIRRPAARRRVLEMRRSFQRRAKEIDAVSFVAVKK